MKYSYDFTINDWLEFNNHYLKSKNTLRNQYIKVIIINSALTAVLMTFFITGKIFSIKVALVTILFIAGWTFLSLQLYKNRVKKNLLKMIKDGENKSLVGRHNVELTDEYIISEVNGNESKLSWKTVEKYVEYGEYIFLYVSSVSAIIIPKNRIKSDNSIEEIIEYIKRNYKGA